MKMSVKSTALKQYQKIVNLAAKICKKMVLPKKGWIYTLRKALNISTSQLSSKLDAHRSLISRFEKDELTGSITIKSMQKIAKAMQCRFVYAMVPENNVEELIMQQAKLKAKKLVEQTSIQMALEKQALSNNEIQAEIEQLTQELILNMPKNFWSLV
jgi:predicted DNA-binding mobile mystery protein A